MPKKKKGPISMVEISELAGVSIATVSRVINQSGRYSEETRKRVEDIIQKYNYVPNMAAKGLKTKRSNFIGIIVPDITNEFFSRIILEIQNSLRQEGYLALVCNTNESEEIESEYVGMLNAAQMAGMIFISGNTHIAENSIRSLPAIYIDRQPEQFDNDNFLVIESDNYGGARVAVKKLAERGCKNIACMYAAGNISSHKRRLQGYQDELEALGLREYKELNLPVKEVSYEAGKRRVLEFLNRDEPCDGLFCATDWLALGALAAFAERGIRVPEDVRVIGFDGITAGGVASKPLTTVYQQVDVMGQTAATEILRLIDGETVRAKRIEIAVSLIERATT